MSAADPRWPSERLMRSVERTPMPANVAALLDTRAMLHPERPYLEFFEDGETLSYAEVSRRVRRVAAMLHALGVRRGTPVAVMVATSSRYPLAWLALASLGAVTVPVNNSYTAPELDTLLRDSRAAWLVIDHDLLPVFDDIEGGACVPRERVIVGGARAPGYAHQWEALVERADAGFVVPDPPCADDLMNIHYTSGTTGMPRGALQSQRFWLTFGRVGAAQFLDRPRRILIAQPFYYLDGQWLTLMACWLGATAVIARRMQASRFMDWVREQRIDYCNFPELASRQAPRADDWQAQLVAMSCYSHRPENYPLYERRYGGLARQGFSMTELGCALYVPMEATAMTGTGTVGIPSAFREAMIADAEGHPLGAGVEGELCVRGAAIAQGYHDRPEATAAAFHAGGWFRTGDLARRDAAGWFWYLGRLKDTVRRAGENISAVEVESVLRAVPGVLEAAVLPVPDGIRGEEVKAYLRLAPDEAGGDALIARVLAHCQANLARFKIPRYLACVRDFPRTPSLKIRKSALIAAAADLREGAYDRVERRWR